jgi:hypothetical protein
VKRALFAALLVLTSMLAGLARADDEATKHSYRAVVDRIELQPSPLGGLQLRVYLSALAIGGQLLDLSDPKSIKLYVGTGEKKVPYSLGNYAATHSDTAMVVIVQASLDYADVLAAISESLDRDLLTALGDRTQIIVLPFGETAATGKLQPIKQARGKLALSTDNSAGDPALLDAIDRALLILKKAKTEPEGRPLRKMIVVVGDGRDLSGDKERVTRTGTRASKEGVRIHSIAYSSTDVRRPMLALGELSKRSFGTFRWVRTASGDSWKAAFEQLRDEINQQYVITYYVLPEHEVAGRKMHIVTVGRTEATSNEMKIPELPACGATECPADYCMADKCVRYRGDGGRGILGWLLLIGGVIVGLVVLLGVVGFFIQKAQHSRVAPPPGWQPGMPLPPGVQPPQPKAKKSKKGAAPAAAPPGFLPNGRPIPVLLITSGPRNGERFMLRNGFLIGKQPGCDLLIEDGYTSSQHAQIGMDANGVCKLYDRQSTNGTYVNGVRVTESALTHGLTIRIGSTEMRFLTE